MHSEEVMLEIRDDAMLFEVMQRLSQERGQVYDIVNFTFERQDDGIRQRMDPNTQVAHLQPHSSVLTIVRKDGGGRSDDACSRREDLPHSQFDSALRRPPPSVFFFNEYTVSMTQEYVVTVAVGRESRASQPVQCTLVVDRERLYHHPPRGSAVGIRSWSVASATRESSGQKKSSFMSPLFRKFTKHLSLAESSRTEPSVFAERRVCDIKSIACDETLQRGFSIVYTGAGAGASEGGTFEVGYLALTPTECAEIVARIEFLRTLATR